MQREEVARICDRQVLDTASRLFGVSKDALTLVAGYEGCANLVYEYQRDGQSFILRISFRPDRTAAQIQAELHFVNYLAEHGIRVSRPIPSQNGNLLETVQVRGMPLHIVSFVKGKGMRVPDNQYRYREDAPIAEYFQNWGRVLGQMHALAKDYQPASDQVKRPGWFEIHQSRLAIETQVPQRLPIVRERIQSLLKEIRSLPRDRDSYGLIHGDFNDGNFTVDYTNGDMTVFDLDDCCYFWFIYELASAWEGGIGRAMFRDLAGRQAFMEHYMEQVMAGYNRENSMSAEWLARLPLFIRLIQVEEFLHFVQYIDEPDEEMQAQLDYKIKCIEDEIPYMGFFDSIYSPERPFSL
ncbi:MAG: phosphotransferase [Chloroflexi bacterium]|nr:phosphotransferase [Chloroflexota bacterium]MBU1746399.1 phosphotransferase [Chloroflexota bacterium]